ncbi:hypothetical protein [Flavobacterium sp. IMCC34518]|uniref:hypothetical protein n=1 Tax=Flavobacterium sp. IMCC34518 TaxID=3003623 RepID=UPI0022AC84FE|nr:hypothetical protein [Flavobacterium sp. IMCC34518]
MTATKPRIYTGEGSPVDDYFNPKSTTPTPKSSQNQDQSNWGLFDKNNQQHKTLLSLLRQAQWTIPHERWGEVADLPRLSEFLKSDKSPIKKPLKKMEPWEVSKIIEAFKGIVKSTYK